METLSLQYCGIGAYGASALAQDIVANDYCVLKCAALGWVDVGQELGLEGEWVGA